MVETSNGKIPNIKPRASTPDLSIMLLLPTLTYLNEDTGEWIKVGIERIGSSEKSCRRYESIDCYKSRK